jgi:hypothetical protein
VPIDCGSQAGALQGEKHIGVAVGLVVNRFNMKKHFDLQIEDRRFAFPRKTEKIAAEAALDGIYILRTSTQHTEFSGTEVVRSYKQLARVERAFHTLKQSGLDVSAGLRRTQFRRVLMAA